MTEVMMSPAAAKAAAINCMQATLIADGIRRLGNDVTKHLRASVCFIEVWSPEIRVAAKRLLPLRFYHTQVDKGWVLSWCDDAGNAVEVHRHTPLYVTVRYAGEQNFPHAAQAGAAAEMLLANAGYTLLDYRQHQNVLALQANGKLSLTKGKK